MQQGFLFSHGKFGAIGDLRVLRHLASFELGDIVTWKLYLEIGLVGRERIPAEVEDSESAVFFEKLCKVDDKLWL